ncbi:MAG: hypothetical protein ACRDOK_06565 [Streptosporangiaceae bacterium]
MSETSFPERSQRGDLALASHPTAAGRGADDDVGGEPAHRE